jgi:hypothetical protein
MGTNALNDRRAGTDVVLTNLSLGIPIDQDFIGDRLLPSLPIMTSVAKIPVWGTEAFRIREDRVGDFSEPDKLDISIDTTTFEVDGHALMAPVSDRHQLEAQQSQLNYDLEFEALQTVVASMRLAREKMQADLVTSAAVYDTSHKIDLNGTAARWDDSSVDPITNILAMLETTVPDDSGKRPNTLWMGQPVWAALLTNSKLLDRLYGSMATRSIPKASELANLLGIETILVGRAISRTVGGVVTKLWGKNAGLVYVAPAPGKRVQSFGYTVEQTVFGNASEKVIKFRDEKMGASGGDWVKRSSFYTPTVTGKTSGSLFYNAVA